MATMKEAQREALKNTKKATCWDSLQLMVVDVAGKPEVFSKTVDQVTASSVAPSAIVMLNTGEVVKTKEDEHWPPNYKFIRKSGGLVAQVQSSLQFQEFQGKKITLNLSFYSILFWSYSYNQPIPSIILKSTFICSFAVL